MSLQGQYAIITGSSRGLGAQIARDMWLQGANLILIARSNQALQPLILELTTQSSYPNQQSLEVIACDLAEPQAVNQLGEKLASFNRIDILVNNAAIQGPAGLSWEVDWEQWQRVIQVNLLAPIALTHAVIPLMVNQQYGRIINLAGGGATSPRINFSAYAVAKTGLVRFTENLAQELANDNILINAVSPGVMNTDMLREFLDYEQQSVGEKEYAKIKAQAKDGDATLLRASQLCCFLASGDAKGINGKLISAVWDPWQQLTKYVDLMKHQDIYTLRRIVPEDRDTAIT